MPDIRHPQELCHRRIQMDPTSSDLNGYFGPRAALLPHARSLRVAVTRLMAVHGFLLWIGYLAGQSRGGHTRLQEPRKVSFAFLGVSVSQAFFDLLVFPYHVHRLFKNGQILGDTVVAARG